MRDKDTVVVTVTLPSALYAAVKELADTRVCSNVSAVVRASLYKAEGIFEAMEARGHGEKDMREAEARTVKYSPHKRGPRKPKKD